MENTVIVKMELEVVAQRLISQYMVNNELIKSQVEAGIKRAFENFDVESAVESAISGCIQTAIKSSSDWGKIRDVIKVKTDEIVDSYIEVAVANFRRNHPLKSEEV